MNSKIFQIIPITFFLVFFAVIAIAATTNCPNFCSDSTAFSSGYYDTGLQKCGYASTISCQTGCNTTGTACNTACTDSDATDIYTKGTTTGLDYYGTSTITSQDYCTESDGGAQKNTGAYVAEETCNSQNKVMSQYIKCPANYYCSAGKCIQANCTDTDGNNINTKGTATGLDYYGNSIVSSSDYCTATDGGAQTSTGKWVAEERCDSQSKVHAYYYQCPTNYSCSDGKCIQQAATCTDSDGTDIYNKGTTTGLDYYKTATITSYDYCTQSDGGAQTSTGTWVGEETCNSQNQVSTQYIQCPSGYTCVDGKCATQITGGCTDPDGTDIYSKGTTTGLDYYATTTITSHDYCTESNGGAQTTTGQWIGEETCNSQNQVSTQYIQCPTNYTCNDGKCIQQNLSCTDNDANDIYTKGTTTGLDYYGTTLITSIDSCTDSYGGADKTSGKWVVENVCDSQAKAHAYYYQCPANYSCSDGKCVSQTSSNSQCSDPDGTDIYTKGFTKGLDYYGTQTISSYDYCTQVYGGAQKTSGKWVAEEQCDSDGKMHAYYYECPANSTCSDGKCSKTTTDSNNVVSTPMPAQSCKDYCSNGKQYFNGYYSTVLGRCIFLERNCDFGCETAGTSCIVKTECPDKCRGSTLQINGYFDTRLNQCEYYPYQCKDGCNASTAKCNLVDMSCPDKCRNNSGYINGYYDTRLMQCEYTYVDCTEGCNTATGKCNGQESTLPIKECSNYCSNGIVYTQGQLDIGTHTCNFIPKQCPTSCNEAGTDCYETATDSNFVTRRACEPNETPGPQCVITCEDNDARDLHTKGTTSGADYYNREKITVTDSCTDVYGGPDMPSGAWVVEIECDNEAKAHANYYECPQGEWCSDGKCIFRGTANDVNRARYESRMYAQTTTGGTGYSNDSFLPQRVVVETTEGVEADSSGREVVLKRGESEYRFSRNFNRLAATQTTRRETIRSIRVNIENDMPVYEVEKTRRGMLLGIFPVEMDISSKLNAETLSVLSEYKPWWSSFVFEEAETAINTEIIEDVLPEDNTAQINTQSKGCERDKMTDALVCPDDDGTTQDYSTADGTETEATAMVETIKLAASETSVDEIKIIENNPVKEKITVKIKEVANRAEFPKLEKTLVSMMNFVENNCMQNPAGVLCPSEKIYSIEGIAKTTPVEVEIKLKQADQDFSKQFVTMGGDFSYYNQKKRTLIGKIPLGKLKELNSLQNVVTVNRFVSDSVDWDLNDDAMNLVKLSHLQSVGQTGKGVKIVVLDIGFDGYINAQANGDLPGAGMLHYFSFVNTPDNTESHGRMVAETVHAIAPDAEIFLYRVNGLESWDDAIEEAIDQKVDILTSSISRNAFGPANGKGVYEDVVKKAADAGILWFQSAGNEQRMFFHKSMGAGDDEWIDFTAGDETDSVTLAKNDELTVEMRYDQWGADGHGDAKDDYDLLIFTENDDGELEEFAKSSNDDEVPYERINFIAPKDGVYRIAIREFDKETTGNVLFSVYTSEKNPEYVSDGKELKIPSTSPYAITVGAVHQGNAFADYSSRGPTMDGRIKPDFGAPAGFVLPSGGNAIFGTSFSTPFLAASAAVLGQLDFKKHNDIYNIFKFMTTYEDETQNNNLGWGIPHFDKTFNNVSCIWYNVKDGKQQMYCNDYPLYVRNTATVSLKLEPDSTVWNSTANESKSLTLTGGQKLLLEYPKWNGIFLSTTGKSQPRIFDITPQQGDTQIKKKIEFSGILTKGLANKTTVGGGQKLSVSITGN